MVCGDQTLMREEHPSAYEAVEQVVADVKQHGLATGVATLHPVLTYKSATTREASGRQPKREGSRLAPRARPWLILKRSGCDCRVKVAGSTSTAARGGARPSRISALQPAAPSTGGQVSQSSSESVAAMVSTMC